MATISISARGATVTATAMEVDEVRDMPEMQALATLLEWDLCNGWTLIEASEMGALSEAPVLSQSLSLSDDGMTYEGDGPLFVFYPYQVRSVLDDIVRRGGAVFSLLPGESR